jgi:hypothetical protein
MNSPRRGKAGPSTRELIAFAINSLGRDDNDEENN